MRKIRQFIKLKRMKYLNSIWCVVIKRKDGSTDEAYYSTKFFAKRGLRKLNAFVYNNYSPKKRSAIGGFSF